MVRSDYKAGKKLLCVAWLMSSWSSSKLGGRNAGGYMVEQIAPQAFSCEMPISLRMSMESGDTLVNSAAIMLGIIVLLGIVYIPMEVFFEERKFKGARILSIISTFIIILTFITLIYSLQNNADMATATATMILVVITGFYAWNTHIQVASMDEQAHLIRDQADRMKEQVAEMQSQTQLTRSQYELAVNALKRERIEKEMDLLILPLKTIYLQIDSRGIDSEWWGWYTHHRRQATDPDAYDKFNFAVQSIDQNKHIAPKDLYPFIDEFIARLRDMKRSDDRHHIELLKLAATRGFRLTKGRWFP